MNKFIASAAIAAVLTACATSYASGNNILMGLAYPPIACSQTDTQDENEHIIVKFKVCEIFNSVKKNIFNQE